MSSLVNATTPGDVIAPRNGAIHCFLASLRTLVAPVLERTGASLAFVGGEESVWIEHAADCGCELPPGPSIETSLDSSCAATRRRMHIDFALDGVGDGVILVCCDRDAEWLSDTVKALADVAIRQYDRDATEASLLEELSLSWESLEALYDISADLQWSGKPGKLLEGIVARAARSRENCGAAFWLERDGNFMPVASTDAAATAAGVMRSQAIADIVTRRTGLVMNNHSEIAELDGLPRELHEAPSLAIAPVATRQGLVGVLTVWSVADGADFESRAIRLFEALALQAAMVIENDNLRIATIDSERLRNEIEIGSKIQGLLLSPSPPGDLPGVTAAALSLASRHIDGDFFDFVRQDGSSFDVIVGDVMGKGVPAAILGAATKNSFLRAMSCVSARTGQRRSHGPADILAEVQCDMSARLIELESFVTLCYARFDVAARCVEMIDCGHASPIQYHRSTGVCELLRGENLPLGVLANEEYVPRFATFEPGDTFVFYSDGVTEAANAADELFGESRLAACISANASLGPEALIPVIRKAVDAFSEATVYGDDLTIVVVQIDMPDHSDGEILYCTTDMFELDRVRRFVRAFSVARIPWIDDDWLSQVELGVNEAFANVVEHGFGEHDIGAVTVRAEFAAHQIVILISYRGAEFDPTAAPPPSFEGDRDGGFGLFIVEHSFDEVSYTSDGNGVNHIRLAKHCGESRHDTLVH